VKPSLRTFGADAGRETASLLPCRPPWRCPPRYPDITLGSGVATIFVTDSDRLLIDRCITRHPPVADAAVIPMPNEEAGEVPKAYVVLKGEATPDQIMAFLILKSPSGKILRRVLVERERARA
jgi:hypothetical protein